ncbi:MAG: hypothetical protein NVS1B4_21610 [Gemmatimonadaceae bacterium]
MRRRSAATRAAQVVGAWSVVRAPFWLRRGRLLDLLKTPAARPAPSPPPAAIDAALGAIIPALDALSALPVGPWRNTCLFRSVAECLVLRHYGVAASLRIGVKNEEPPHGKILAHAWVVRGPDAAADSFAPALALDTAASNREWTSVLSP